MKAATIPWTRAGRIRGEKAVVLGQRMMIRAANAAAVGGDAACPFGAIGFGIAKAAGADDQTAIAVGEMARNAGRMAGAHQQAVQQGSATYRPGSRGPGQPPRL